MRLCKPSIDKCILNTRDYDAYISDRLGNNLFISDPERADRLYEHAAYGGDGSTHAEVIDDWRDFVRYSTLPERCKEKLYAEIDAVEQWHADNGSLDNIIG